ncbi:MAG: protein translocase subunit SecF [Nitrospiria bacterium]
MFELLGKTNFDFIGKRYLAFSFSGLFVVLGLLSAISIGTGKANLGIDFAGGTAVQLKFDRPVKIEDARQILERNDLKDAELQEFSNGNKLLIRIKNQSAIQEKISEKIVSVFSKEYPDNRFVVDSTEQIGPTIGQKLQRDATLAVGISILGIIIYIALRFEFRFGVAAAVATFHDVLAVLGIFFILHREINLLVVTALLTVAGYSLTDTVVVFDRIRENLKKRSREGLDQVINSGINQVLSRTIVVSLTVFLVLLALFFFGGEVIHDFSFALLLGVVIGTYSSIFVASPILVIWKGSNRKLLRPRA